MLGRVDDPVVVGTLSRIAPRIQDGLRTLQTQCMAAARANLPVRLSDALDLPLLSRPVDRYLSHIPSKENA